MSRKTMLLLLVLPCLLLSGGCFPGFYTSRPAASGVVMDAVSGEPLLGVLVTYGDEEILTDGQGAFSFAEQTGIAMYYIGGEGPEWGQYHGMSFSKDEYALAYGQFWELFDENGAVRLEPVFVRDGLAALDDKIAEASVMTVHRADGSVLVGLELERPAEFGSIEELSRETLNIADKIVHSGLVGATPDLDFLLFCRENGTTLWYMEIGWQGEDLGRLDRAKAGAAEWLNSAAYVFFHGEGPSGVFAKFAEDEANKDAYGPFIGKGRSSVQAPYRFRR